MSDNAREIFVKNLRYLMDARGITQADICRELGVSSATVSNWFTGQKYPRIDRMQLDSAKTPCRWNTGR